MKNESTIAAVSQFVQSIHAVKARWSELNAATTALQTATADFVQALDSLQRSGREVVEALGDE